MAILPLFQFLPFSNTAPGGNMIKKHINLSTATAVLVRFHFSNEKVVPKGLRSIERLSERELISKRMKAVGANNAADTRGVQVVQNLARVQVAILRKGLANAGLRLVDGHTLEERVKFGKKYISTMGYRRLEEGEILPEIPDEAMHDLRAFATDAVWTAHIWDNPNGVVVIELMMRQPGLSPLCAITVRDNHLSTVGTEVHLTEDEETMKIGQELLDQLDGLQMAM